MSLNFVLENKSNPVYRLALNSALQPGTNSVEFRRVFLTSTANSKLVVDRFASINAPATGTSYRADDNLSVQWTPLTSVATSEVTIKTLLNCPGNSTVAKNLNTADDGQFDYALSAFLVDQSGADSCQLTVGLSKNVSGVAAPRLASNSYFTAVVGSTTQVIVSR